MPFEHRLCLVEGEVKSGASVPAHLVVVTVLAITETDRGRCRGGATRSVLFEEVEKGSSARVPAPIQADGIIARL